MHNDSLRVFTDDKLVLETPLIATYPNQQYTVPLSRCRKLRFENKGSSTLNVAAFGVADLVIYRGEPTENDLFTHSVPQCPPTVDLIDLGAPYIHYVSPMKDAKDKTFHDGSTRREFFDLHGQPIYKGFMLQTSVHFSLDHGPLSGTDNAAAATVGAAAVGSAFVAGGVAVGGAVVGSTLIGAAAFLMLAAGGEAMENSLAAFNTYGQYNSVTFTVACLNPRNIADDYTETLLIGADQQKVAELTVYETMEPQTVTVPINGCRQLMFWLANTGNWSGKYIFYDITLSKELLPLNIPKAARLSNAVITTPIGSSKMLTRKWARPTSSGSADVDSYLSGVSNTYSAVEDIIAVSTPYYDIRTYYLETSNGQICKAVTLKSQRSEKEISITSVHAECAHCLEKLNDIKESISKLNVSQASAIIGLPSIGFKALSYGKFIKAGAATLKECKQIVQELYAEKLAEIRFLNQVLSSAVDIDGKQSSETTVLCPLFAGETPPDTSLQLVQHFNMK